MSRPPYKIYSSLLLILSELLVTLASQATTPSHNEELNRLNLPTDFRQLIADRVRLDEFQSARYGTESRLLAQATNILIKRPVERTGSIKVIDSPSPNSTTNSQQPLPPAHRSRPKRGYRTILSESGKVELPAVAKSEDPPLSDLIHQRLAYRGLIATLVEALLSIRERNLWNTPSSTVSLLDTSGFPVDLLEHFEPMVRSPEWSRSDIPNPEKVVGKVWQWLLPDSDLREPDRIQALFKFHFKTKHPDFKVSSESGEQQLLSIRMQLGGGYEDGIIPGSCLDVLHSMTELAPELRVMVSVPTDVYGPFRAFAARQLNLRQRGQLTLIRESSMVSAWAQDNGKPGWVGGTNLAVIIPRFASIGEGESLIVPGDSTLMNGLALAGIKIIPSALLFQGGNLTVITDPVRNERVLLIGEGEIWRNQTLGLTPSQVQSIFEIEFSCVRSIILPSVSYHLDFDTQFRIHDGKLHVFVNDAEIAASQILKSGLNSLGLETSVVHSYESMSRSKQFGLLRKHIHKNLDQHRTTNGAILNSFAQKFVSTFTDSGSLNLQCFLVALDFLACEDSEHVKSLSLDEQSYLEAMARVRNTMRNHAEVVESLGWQVTKIPSLPDIGAGMNYLNGVNDNLRLFMPAWGGLYSGIDSSAVAAFNRVLGNSVRVVPVLTADSQRTSGGLHCLISATPAPTTSKPSSPSNSSN